MKTIQLTDEQYQALCLGESVTIEPPKPKVDKWEPKQGNYHVDLNGEVFYSNLQRSKINFGVVYQTREAGERASRAMKTHNRLLAWLAENDDGWVADWDDDKQFKFGVYYSRINDEWDRLRHTSVQLIGTIYMSESNAVKLRKLLNDGVVEL